MAFSVAVPTNDEKAEAKIAAAYATDPGASPDGHYVSTDEAIKDAVNPDAGGTDILADSTPSSTVKSVIQTSTRTPVISESAVRWNDSTALA
jgi:hypothetical protein